MRIRTRHLWYPKDPLLPRDYEDAAAVSEKYGRVVIADGVSSAIFSRAWARLLTRSAVSALPAFADDSTFTGWVTSLQKQWRAGIDFANLHWAQKPKVASVGAQSTLLFVEITPRPEEEGESKGSPTARFEARAIGDCCLFLIRDGVLQFTFPHASAAAFEASPQAISSIRKNVSYGADIQVLESTCLSGDLVVICTDAVALWAVAEYERGNRVDWMRYWDDESAWQHDIETLRARSPDDDGGQMRVDDCTLVLARVVDEPVAESEPDVMPDPSDEQFTILSVPAVEPDPTLVAGDSFVLEASVGQEAEVAISPSESDGDRSGERPNDFESDGVTASEADVANVPDAAVAEVGEVSPASDSTDLHVEEASDEDERAESPQSPESQF